MSDGVWIAAIGAAGVVLSSWLNSHKTRAKVDAIGAEFRNNGGSTIRDAVDRIESRLDIVHRAQVATTERLDKHMQDCG